MHQRHRIQVFEHSFLPLGISGFEKRHFVALSKLNALHKYQYFDLKHNGVVFKQFVGVIHVNGLTIEILPKIDRYENEDEVNKKKWQNVLIEMLRVTKKLKIQQVGQAHVSKQSIHLLDIYFEWFLNEVHLLIHQGLIKQYYKQTENVKALKGKLEFAGHIHENLVHKERFYTTHQVYEKDHLIHQILAQALEIVEHVSRGSYLYSKCKTVQFDFPEVRLIKATENTFSKLPKTRKTAPYDTALQIARLIILNYAPHVKSGSENMLALLFNMNSLWEEYILVSLKKACYSSEIEVFAQNSKSFWNGISIRPDIVLKRGEEVLVIDTKWKDIDQSQPSTHDLRQMYVYNDYWKSSKSILLYPAQFTNIRYDSFICFDDREHSCSIGKLNIVDEKGNLRQNISEEIIALLFN